MTTMTAPAQTRDTPAERSVARPPRRRKVEGLYYAFLLPSLILFTLAITVPAIIGIFFSFTNSIGFGDWEFVGFINYRHTLKTAEVGFNKKVSHAEGSGERTIHFEERPGFLAKSRYATPSSLPYKAGRGWEELSKYMPEPTGVAA